MFWPLRCLRFHAQWSLQIAIVKSSLSGQEKGQESHERTREREGRWSPHDPSFPRSSFRSPWPPRDAASGASHLSATIVSALVHGYVSTTLFRFVIFVFRPIVACRSSSPLLAPPRRSATPPRPLAASSRAVVAAALVFLALRAPSESGLLLADADA
jgi:hypothetical protein